MAKGYCSLHVIVNVAYNVRNVHFGCAVDLMEKNLIRCASSSPICNYTDNIRDLLDDGKLRDQATWYTIRTIFQGCNYHLPVPVDERASSEADSRRSSWITACVNM
jgi:hypothetical protein